MNHKKTKILSALLAVLVVLNSMGMPVHAENEASQWEIVSADEAGDAAAEDAPGSTDGDDVYIADEIPPRFPGLPENYTFSGEQLEQKALLSEHAASLPDYNAPDDGTLYVPGELVYMTDSEADAQLAAEAFGGTLDSYAYGVAVIRIADGVTVAQACQAAAGTEVLLPAVWPNYYKELYATYNDPALSEGDDYQWQHDFVGDKYAWAAGYKGQGVKVGVIDSGIHNSHEEFGSRLKQHLSMTGSSAAAATEDPNGHGTHVSGIVAASLNNGKGGAGIAPEADLYVYGVTDADGGVYSAAVLRALNRAVSDKVDVVNLSLGGGVYDGNEDTAIQGAYQAGIAIFAAAGNEATSGVSYPASFDNVCSVAALQEDGKKAPYSNYNNSVDLAFPGSNIYSTYKAGNSSYVYMDGTSMASPVAAGAAAVILSGAKDIPELAGKTGTQRVDALYKIMTQNAKKCPSKGTGAGTTYLPSVFGIAVGSSDTVPAAPTFSQKNKTTFSAASAALEIASASAGVIIYYSTDGKTPAYKNGDIVNGTRYTGAITIGGAKKVTVKAIAVNAATGKASKVTSATYNFAPAPTAVKVTATDAVDTLAPGSSLGMKASVTPSYAVSSKVKWSVAPEGAGVAISASGKLTVAKTAATGKYTVTATAVDKKGSPYPGVQGTYTVTVAQPAARVKSVTLSSKTAAVSVGNTLNLAEGISVTYDNGNAGSVKDVVWSSSNEKIATVANGIVTAVAPGKVNIKATANDGSNKSSVCKVTVTQPATGLVITGPSKLAAGKSITLKAELSPQNVSAKSLDWTATGTGVTVKNGKVKAAKNASGAAVITAKTTDGSGLSKSFTVTIVDQPIKSISMQKTMSLFTTGGNTNAPTSRALNATVNGGDPTAVSYVSSAPSIASVDEKGMVTAHTAGKAKITCTATDGSNKKAVCTVTVGVPMSHLTILTAEDNDGYLAVGCKLKLKAFAGESYGKPQSTKVVWSVPDRYKDLISVNGSGVVTAKAFDKSLPQTTYGTSVIVTATAADGSGVSASYNITLIRKIKDFALGCERGIFLPLVLFDNDTVAWIPYNTTITAAKGRKVGHQSVSYSGIKGIMPDLDKPTTTKTSAQSRSFTASDGIKITVKVKLQTGNKSASKSILLIKTSDGEYYYQNR